ncbi:MAG: hypothetical protein ABSG27_14805 [Candidatus Acidiferrales bacterium]|jgi:hypothetical protein
MSSISFGEWGEYISALIVVIAVTGKYVADFTSIWDEEKRRLVSKKSALVLIGSLAVELVCIVGTNVHAARERYRLAIDLEREKQKTAASEFKSAQDQKDLWILGIPNQQSARQLADIIFKQSQRVIDFNAFVNALKGKPKAYVNILYKREDMEAWELASQIYQALGEKDAGWDVFKPMPLPISYSNEEPTERKFGGGLGIGVVSKQAWHGGSADTALDALVAALRISLGEFAAAEVTPNQQTDLPDNTIRLVTERAAFLESVQQELTLELVRS